MLRFLILALLLFCFGACGSSADKVAEVAGTATITADESEAASETPTPSPSTKPSPTSADDQTVTVVKSGFFQDTTSGYGSTSFGVILKNNSVKSAAENVGLQIAFYDSAGTVLKATSETVAFLLPGEETGIGGSTSIDSGTATTMQVQARVSDRDWSDWDKGTATFTFEAVTMTDQQFGGLQVNGEIVNPFTVDIEDARLNAVFLDADSNIIGGYFTFQDFVPAGGRAAFEISSFDDVPAAAVQVYGSLSYLSLSGLQ